MKFIYITCNVSMLETITDLLSKIEFTDYQVIEQVEAISRWGDPRQNTAVWPGYNSSILIQESDEEKVNELMSQINEINEEAFNNSELIAAYTLNIEDYINIKPVDK